MSDITAQTTKTATPNWIAVLNQPERMLVALLFAIAALSLAVSLLTGQRVAWGAFSLTMLPTLGLFLAGLYIRTQKNAPNIAHLAIANSLYLGFTGMTTLLIYLRFPIHTPLLDDTLMQIDAIVGYSWPDVLSAFAQYPFISYILGLVYMSSLPQLFVMVAILALTGRILKLHRALFAGSLSLLLTTAIWWIAPSIGPSAFFDIPAETVQAMSLVTDMHYGAALRQLVESGLPIIQPSDIIGTIAFPSYHTVMALLVVWYLRGTALFWPALVVNVIMAPAILSHGGHHLTDVVGGVITFAIAAWAAARFIPAPAQDDA